MKTAWTLTAFFLLVYIISSCKPQATAPGTPGEEYVKQRTAVEIEGGKPLTVNIQALSGNSENDIGLQCSPEVWQTLTNSTNVLIARLISSSSTNTYIGGIHPGIGGISFLNSIPNVHYLFYVVGGLDAKATVEMTFPNAPAGPTHANIIVCITAGDTGL